MTVRECNPPALFFLQKLYQPVPIEKDDHQMDSLLLRSFLDFNEDGCKIETSVNVNEENPEDNDQKPQTRMKFSSVIEAEEFYKNYAKKTGFTVRKGKIHKQRDGTLKWRRFLCSCEGFRAKKQSNQGTKYQRLDTRTGCEAQMQVTLENEQWVITNLQLEHNHSLQNSNGSSDKSIQDTLTGPSEKLEGASEADKVCPKHQLKQLKPQAVDSRRAKGETSSAPAEAEDRDKTLWDQFIGNLTRLLKENNNEQLFEEVTKLKSIFCPHPKNQGNLSQQTQEDSASSYSEQSMAKASDGVETRNYVESASDRLTMEERSLPIAKSADEELGQPSLPTIYSAQVPTTNDVSHWFRGGAVSIASSTVPTPTLPITTITSAGTPAAGSSSPHLPCLQDKCSGASRDQGKQCTSFGGVNTIVQVEGSGVSHTSESIWQQILTKYGDITAKCTLTSPEFVAFVKQSILKIVNLMHNNTARGLSDENISTIGRILGDLERVEVKVDWLRTRFVAVGHLIDYAKAKDNRDMILRRFNEKRAQVAQLQLHLTQLQGELDEAEASLQELKHQVPEWLTFEDTLGKGLL
ncbi:uncharacterized protein LOC117905938 isoform X2 [Vitis riparia]|uniref:uncharacterized protein LOC117905938 isoform X2 n=1 Tax=Vitis riparia TaxID=96939 RepID=UPI00155A2746|nr:uncharacterized protein LOC117905938 isoform X2 [Vitis riparia]